MLDPRFVGYREVKALGRNNSYRAVELAEQEAEERMRKELTRWHDPKKPPGHLNTVLVKVEEGVYNTGHYDGDYSGFFLGSDFYYLNEIVGWREIHENK